MTASDYRPDTREQKFLKYHESLRNELNTANWHFTAYTCLVELGKDYGEELGVAPAFFGLTIRAHQLETTMRLCRCLDKRKDSANIHRMLDYVEANIGMFDKRAFRRRIEGKFDEEMVEDILREQSQMTLTRIQEQRKRIEALPKANLVEQRNKALAHADEKMVLAGVDVFKKYPVQVADVKVIINTLDEILNEYSVAYDSSGWVKDLPLEYGIKEIVDSIRFKQHEEKKRWGLS